MTDQKRPGPGLTRRRFLEAAAASAVALGVPLAAAADDRAPDAAAEPRRRPHRFLKNGKPLLVVVEGTNPDRMLEAGLEALGGLKSLVGGGVRVAIKPNLVTPQPYPVTSDLALTAALVGRLRSAGAGDILVCDGPTRPGALRLQPFERNGWFVRCQELGIRAVAVDNLTGDYQPVRHSSWACFSEIRADRLLIDAPVVINQPTLKRHFLPGMSCVFKNYLGSVYGPDRRRAHDEADKGADGVTFFKKAMAEFADSLRSELTIVDARSLLVKGGPSLTAPGAAVKPGVNRMILGSDMVAVEAYAVRLLKQEDGTFSAAMADDTLEWAEHLGIGTADLTKIEIVEKTA